MAEANVVGLFRNVEAADNAVRKLLRAGFDREDLSLFAREEVLSNYRDYLETEVAKDEQVSDVAEGAGAGALAGGVAGGLLGLLAGIGAIVVPGVGPLVAAGSLAVAAGLTAGGAGLGAAVGGIIGAAASLGLTEEEAQVYAEGVRLGGVLVVVETTEERTESAEAMMREAGALDVNNLREEWSEAGWEGFVADTEPGDPMWLD